VLLSLIVAAVAVVGWCAGACVGVWLATHLGVESKTVLVVAGVRKAATGNLACDGMSVAGIAGSTAEAKDMGRHEAMTLSTPTTLPTVAPMPPAPGRTRGLSGVAAAAATLAGRAEVAASLARVRRDDNGTETDTR
jgi:hypothetical protein